MLGIKKKPFQGKGKRVFVSVDKFCLEGENVSGAMPAMESKNCDCSNGWIKNGVGLTALKLNGKTVPINFTGNIHGLYLIDGGGELDAENRVETLFCLTKEEKLYRYDEGTSQFVYQFDMPRGSRYCMAANKDKEWYAVFSAGKGYYVVNGTTFTKCEEKREITAICFFKGRIFLGEKHCRLRYSKVDSPWDFSETLDESGIISLAYDFGEIVALIPFRDRVYVFMDYGVAVLEAGGSPLDFKIAPLDYSGGKIFGESVGVCNNSIMFLTEGGVVRFNGSRFEKVAKNLRISPKRDTQVCNYGVCGDNYIVRYQAISAEKRSVVVKADGKGYFISDREGLSQSGGRTLCVANGSVYEIVPDGYVVGTERYYFKSQTTNFGLKQRKKVRSLRIEGEGGYTLFFYCDGVWRHSTANFEDGVAVVSIERSGQEFAFHFQLEQGAVIRKVVAELQVTA